MTRAQLKARARMQLGNGIFTNPWLMAVLVSFIHGAVMGVGSNIPAGALILIGPMSYGMAYVFLKQARDNQPINVGDLFKGFVNDFGGTFMIGLMTGLFTALWSLLFVIPGIVKAYSYSMAYYIKLDHPEYNWRQCMNESQAIMQGYKMTLFVQDLSFIGWMIVGSFALGIGTLWVIPYMQATRAQFYNSLVGWQPAYYGDPYAQQYTQR